MFNKARGESKGFPTFLTFIRFLFQHEFGNMKGMTMTQKLPHIPHIHRVSLQCEFSDVQWNYNLIVFPTFFTFIGLFSVWAFICPEFENTAKFFPHSSTFVRFYSSMKSTVNMNQWEQPKGFFHINVNAKVSSSVFHMCNIWSQPHKAFPRIIKHGGFFPVKGLLCRVWVHWFIFSHVVIFHFQVL